jgi:fibronectin type 3 domain-containing protein
MNSEQGWNFMQKQIINFRRFTAMGVIFCLVVFIACGNGTDDDTKSDPEKPTTFVKFTNLEQYKVTVYRDSLRQNVFAEVAALGSITVDLPAPSSEITFYPTFHLDIFDVPGISIPYNDLGFSIPIKADTTNSVNIPPLKSIQINSAFIKITNNGVSSLTLRQGNSEERPLGGVSSLVMPDQSAVYQIAPGSSSGYSIRDNSPTPVAFPAGFTEFRPGIIYVFAYNGTSLTLVEERSVLQTIPPSVPENVNAKMVSSDSVLITWDAVYGATSYGIYRATSAEGAYSSVGTSVTASFTDISGSTGQIYYYKITALSGAGADRESERSTAVTAINVRVTATIANSVSLAWNAVSGASGYNVYRSATEAGAYNKVNTAAVTGTEFTDTGLSPDTTYWYKVSAIVNAVEGLQSNQISASTLSSIPGNVRVSAVTTSSVTLAWNAVSGASGYNIYRSTSENGAYSKVNTVAVTSTEFTNTGLSPDMSYWYKVSAIVNGAEGLQSIQISASTLTSVPGNVRVTSSGTSSVTLAWNAVNGASGYNVYRSNNENGTYSKINTTAVTGTEFTDSNVIAYTTYFYKVSAIINGIEGVQSNPISASTGVVVPGSGLAAKLDWLQTNAESNSLYSVEINADEYIVPQTLDYSGKSGITITMSGVGGIRTVNLSANGVLFTVNSGVTLILDNNVTLNGRSGNNSSLVMINSGSTMIMNAGTKITSNSNYSNSAYSYGGGVYVAGTFIMNGGEISSNTTAGSISYLSHYSYGGGIYVAGTFTMNGGKISNNTAYSDCSYSYGGGVYVAGTFTMNGGEISNNTAYYYLSFSYLSSYSYGGGVYVRSGTFTMNGGTISGNTANGNTISDKTVSYGGGVYVYDGTFNMKSGEISNNTATDSGGGIWYGINNGSTFRMSGGVIYGSNAADGLRNTAGQGVAFYRGDRGTAQYGTFSSDTFYASGNLSTRDTTIRIVNGNLLTE